ncbi:HlyD family efflux transporter periplasmic adaptor subunit [Spongiactinospora sp. 9N601]|uniref:HlyD family efflux transporter periplasmic adaptor subunit n=1 Tax=Spongiactinospora sp. 9N601 TaxID=3375149 RepID=UPI0037A56A72
MIQFRSEAVARAQAPDVLDQPVRLTSPRTWLVLAALALVVIVGAVWAFTGTLRTSVDARGLLTLPRGSFPIQAIKGGQVSDVFVKPGGVVAPDGRIAAVRSGGVTVEVRSPARGRVFSVPVRHGQVVRPGETLAVAEYADGPDDRLVAALFVPAARAAGVRVGGQVDLTVESAAAAGRYGVLRGRVKAVDPAIWTLKDVAAFVGDEGMAQLVGGPGPGPVQRVTVELTRSSATASGYAWSTASGPPSGPRSRTPVTGAIHGPAMRPIDWILP